MNIWDLVNDINFDKKNVIKNCDNPQLAESIYKPFVVNRTLSRFHDTVIQANEMNKYHSLDNYLQFSYLSNSIRKRKRFKKKDQIEKTDDVELVSKYFKISRKESLDFLKLINKQEIEEIRRVSQQQ